MPRALAGCWPHLARAGRPVCQHGGIVPLQHRIDQARHTARVNILLLCLWAKRMVVRELAPAAQAHDACCAVDCHAGLFVTQAVAKVRGRFGPACCAVPGMMCLTSASRRSLATKGLALTATQTLRSAAWAMFCTLLLLLC